VIEEVAHLMAAGTEGERDRERERERETEKETEKERNPKPLSRACPQ
jgi:hypothetical protein